MIPLKAYENLANYKVRRNNPQTALTFDTNYKFEGFPKPPSGSVICYKSSQKSLSTILLTFTVCYRERIQIEIIQGKKYIG